MSNHHPYTLPREIDMGDLRLIAGIEKPCAGLRINLEDWARLDFPAFCGLVPVYPVEDVEPNTISAMRESDVHHG